jgi:hypothetical protein
VNGEQKRILKEAVVAYFKALYQHSPGGTERNHKNSSVGIAGSDSEQLKKFEN